MNAAAVVAELRAAVALQEPVDQRHARSIELFVDALDRLPSPLDEAADPTHVTASGIVVGPRGTVLHKHKRIGMWMQPGGHLDPGEHPADAVLREVAEETGLTAAHPAAGPQLFHVDVHPAGSHIHLDLRYAIAAEGDDLRPGPGESPHVQWFSWEEALTVADAALVGALRLLAPG